MGKIWVDAYRNSNGYHVRGYCRDPVNKASMELEHINYREQHLGGDAYELFAKTRDGYTVMITHENGKAHWEIFKGSNVINAGDNSSVNEAKKNVRRSIQRSMR